MCKHFLLEEDWILTHCCSAFETERTFVALHLMLQTQKKCSIWEREHLGKEWWWYGVFGSMGLELERGPKLFFPFFWNKLSLLFFLCFLHCSFIYDGQRTFVAVQFECLMTQKLLNLVKEWGNIKHCLMISICLVMSGFILNCFSHLKLALTVFWGEHLYRL